MSLLDTRRIHVALAAAAVLAFGACDDVTSPTSPDAGFVSPTEAAARASATDLTVMSWNVWLGGETSPLYSLDFPNPEEDSPSELQEKTLALLTAVNTFWGGVQASDAPTRAAAIAREIASASPEVVALQEVASYAVLDPAVGPIGGFDFMSELEAALEAEGVDYDVVIRQENTEATFPLDIDLQTFQFTAYLSVKLGEATLVRSDVKVLDSESAEYAANLDLGPVSVDRGWSRVRVKHGGVPHDVVNTHLEVQGVRPVHDAQAAELIYGVLAGLDEMTVLVGDLNSDAWGAQDGSNPKWTPTWGLLRDAGFVDAWLEAESRTGTGPTCCDETLGSGPLDTRVDFVMVRRPDGAFTDESAAGVHISEAHLLGDDASERTSAGLRPSDHLGLVAEFGFPGGRR